MLILDGNGVANAVGSELDSATSYADIVNAITFDKTILSNALNTFGVVASPSDSLVELINKTIPLSVNFIEPASDFFATDPVTTTMTNTSADIISLSAPETSENLDDSFGDFIATPSESTGEFYSGGDADDTTHPKHFTIVFIDPYDTMLMTVDSTTGMQTGDELVQGFASTTISLGGILDGNHLVVVDTTGFVASALISTF